MKFINSIFKTSILSLLIIAQVRFAYAQTASILPPAETTFNDKNGKPLTSGTVDFYIPGSTVRKSTWQDAAETVPNLNPVVLDAAGRALILGSGNYRQVVKDRNGNTIWDQVTSSTGSGSGGGSTATGDGDLVGTIKPWAGMTAPNQYMFTYGQTISRTTFAALFTAITSAQPIFCTTGSPILTGLSDTTNLWIGVPVETSCLASGNSTVISKTATTVTLGANSNISVNALATFFPWGNGNGSTTFNLPDFRGFNIAGNNNMGGTPSSNLTTPFFGAATPNATGAAGGSQTTSITLLSANLPPYTPAGTIVSNSSVSGGVQGGTSNISVGSGAINVPGNTSANIVVTTTSAFTGSAAAGQNSTPIVASIIQPTKTSNYIIKVTPDANSPTASGVTSLGGMTGDIACAGGLLCTGNTISVTANPLSVGGSVITSGTPTRVLFDNGGLLGEYAQVPVANGGTGQATAPTARASSGLNVDSFTGVGNTAYSILTTDRTIGTNAAFTASRTWTLPAANAVNAGQEIVVADFQGTVTGTNTLVISRAGSDTINGGTAVTIVAANGAYLLKSDGATRWTAQALGAAAAGGVSSVTCGTGLTGGTITTSGTCAISAPVSTANGGSGVVSPASHTIPINEGASAQNNSGTGSVGQHLTSNGASADPTFQSGGWTLLNTLTAAVSPTLTDTTSISANYTEYEIVLENIIPGTASQSLELQVQSGGTFQSTTYVSGIVVGNGSTVVAQTLASGIPVVNVAGSATTAPGISARLIFSNPAQTTQPKTFTGTWQTGAIGGTTGGHWNGGNGAITGVQLLLTSGTLTSGVMKIYGRN